MAKRGVPLGQRNPLCLRCGKVRKKPAYYPYCGPYCRCVAIGITIPQKPKQERAPNGALLPGPRVEVPCKYCGKVMLLTEGRSRTKQYCNSTCYQAMRLSNAKQRDSEFISKKDIVRPDQ